MRGKRGRSRLVTVRALDDVEGDLDDDQRLDLPEPTEPPHGVVFEPARHPAISASVKPV